MEHGALPPLNLVCRKPAFMGFVACGTHLEWSHVLKHQFGEWFVELKISLLYMCNSNSSIFLCRIAF